tara:strand:+ start:1410 stop:2990 length:1581 start_codon:yes stop_codon:yes gene_type:complete
MGFSGQIADLPLGDDGLTGTKNLSQIRPTQLIEAESITYENGTLQKEGGTTALNGTSVGASVKVIAGADWIPTTGTQRTIIAGSDGKIYREPDDGTFTAITTGLTLTSSIPSFVTGGEEFAADDRKLFMFSGNNAVQVLVADGTSTADITTPPSDWSGTNQPITGIIHDDRLWGAGNANDPHRAYYSRPTDHENFTGSGSGQVAVFPGDGEYIIQMLSFRGAIVVWKYPVGIYLIDTRDPNELNWSVSRISNTIGGVSPLGASIIEGDIIFMDPAGNFHNLTAVDEFGNLGVNNLSTLTGMDGFIRDNANPAQIDRVRSVFYAAKGQVHFSLPGVGATTNTLRIIADFRTPGQARFASSTRDTAECLFLKEDSDGIQRLTSGDDVGVVYNMDTEGRSKAGSGYNAQFQSSHTDMSELAQELSTVRKMGRFLELVVEPKGNWNLNVDIVWDSIITDTITFNMGTTGATLGSFVFGTDKLAGQDLLNKKHRIVGSGRRFSIIGRNNGDSQDFSVSKFLLHFLPGNERL